MRSEEIRALDSSGIKTYKSIADLAVQLNLDIQNRQCLAMAYANSIIALINQPTQYQLATFCPSLEKLISGNLTGGFACDLFNILDQGLNTDGIQVSAAKEILSMWRRLIDNKSSNAKAYDTLLELKLPFGTNLYAFRSFRLAAVAALRGVDAKQKVEECLSEILDVVIVNINLFGTWVSVFNKMRGIIPQVTSPPLNKTIASATIISPARKKPPPGRKRVANLLILALIIIMVVLGYMIWKMTGPHHADTSGKRVEAVHKGVNKPVVTNRPDLEKTSTTSPSEVLSTFPSEYRESAVKSCLEEAKNLADNKDFSGALKIVNDFIVHHPDIVKSNNGYVHDLLAKKAEWGELQFKTCSKAGFDYEAQQNWPKAVEAYAEALTIKPDDKEIKDKLATCQHNFYSAKAEIAETGGRLDEAIDNYTAALSFKQIASTQTKLDAGIRKREYDKWIAKAQTAEKEKDLSAAVTFYKKAQEYTDESLKEKIISLLLAYAKARDNKVEGKEALKSLDEILSLDTDNSEAIALKEKIKGYYDPNAGNVVTNSTGMRLAYIPLGKFTMGSPISEERNSDEGPQREDKVDRGFYMGVYEVTQGQYKAIMGENPSYFKGDNFPVEQVSWDEASEFCGKLSQKEGKIYRLPTEKEWEYACRANTETAFNNSQNGLTTVQQICWCSYDGKLGSARQTKPVGSCGKNAWGLCDMHGNVCEWCSDLYAMYPNSEVTNLQMADSEQCYVIRGGSWYDIPKDCRSATRNKMKPNDKSNKVGFRVICF